jgi:hypothetical protein
VIRRQFLALLAAIPAAICLKPKLAQPPVYWRVIYDDGTRDGSIEYLAPRVSRPVEYQDGTIEAVDYDVVGVDVATRRVWARRI